MVLAGVVWWFMHCEGDYFGVEGVLGVGETLSCGGVVFVDLEDVGGSIRKVSGFKREGEVREDEGCGVGGEEGAGEGVAD